MPICDKCGREVPPYNDAVMLVTLIEGREIRKDSMSRHLLPVMEGGKTVCPGSPSTAQYIEGQPHDTRPAYAFQAIREWPVRNAYKELLRRYPPPSETK